MEIHTVEHLARVLDTRRSEVEHWTKLLGSRIPESGLTDHQAAAIGAVVWLRRNTPQTKSDLERFFARLAFMTDPYSDWAVHRLPRRKKPEIVLELRMDLSERDSFTPAVLFEKQAFLTELARAD